MPRLLQSALWRGFLSAALAFSGYGGWAFYINHLYGDGIAITAALVQGSYALVLTLILSILLEKFYWSLDIPARLRFIIVFTAACACLYGTAWFIHWLAGTPAIFRTILPGAVIGTVYVLTYLLLLERIHAQTRQ